MVKRVRTNVLIDEELKNEAHNRGVNISRFLEQKLREYIERDKAFREFLQSEREKEKEIKV